MLSVFDACTPDFWRYVSDIGFLHTDDLIDPEVNKTIHDSLKRMFWYDHIVANIGYAENNGLRLSVSIDTTTDLLKSLSITDIKTNEILLSI